MDITADSTRFPMWPTLMTLGNAVCGLGAIGLAARALGEESFELSLYNAGLLIFLGMLFDALDGRVAVWTNQTSEFGKQLDSLCDAITFGVAPAFMMLVFAKQLPLVDTRFFHGIAGLYALCAILRLARYNAEVVSESADKMIFQGLPTPAAASTIAAFAIALPKLSELSSQDGVGQVATAVTSGMFVAVPCLTLVLSYLMVSHVIYPHLTRHLARLSHTRNFYRLVQLTFAVVIILTLHELALPILCTYYVVGSPMLALTRRAARRVRSRQQRTVRLSTRSDDTTGSSNGKDANSESNQPGAI